MTNAEISTSRLNNLNCIKDEEFNKETAKKVLGIENIKKLLTPESDNIAKEWFCFNCKRQGIDDGLLAGWSDLSASVVIVKCIVCKDIVAKINLVGTQIACISHIFDVDDKDLMDSLKEDLNGHSQ